MVRSAAPLAPLVFGGAASLLARGAARARLRSLLDVILGPDGQTAPRQGRLMSVWLAALARVASTAGAGATAVWVGWSLGGPVTATVGGLAAAIAVRAWRRRKAMPDARALDQQVGELAEAISSAVRGGLSIAQAVEFAAAEAGPPLTKAADEFLSARDMGVPFQAALQRLAEHIATDEALLLALVLGVHHRSGGNVAGALDEVARTIRQRLRLRAELRALTAQRRISGLVLGVLPVGFFVVMALTSRDQLRPVLGSAPGAAMLLAGFLLEGLAFLWIRRLLRVEA
jgi:tight adherence protein B